MPRSNGSVYSSKGYEGMPPAWHCRPRCAAHDVTFSNVFGLFGGVAVVGERGHNGTHSHPIIHGSHETAPSRSWTGWNLMALASDVCPESHRLLPATAECGRDKATTSGRWQDCCGSRPPWRPGQAFLRTALQPEGST